MLLNLHFGGDQAKLIELTKDGKREISEPYYPHFYAICDNPEEKCYLFSQHPMILETKIENGAVKIRTPLADFKTVISDIRKIPGVRELAETSVPHHFRFSHEKQLKFLDGEERLRLGVVDARGLWNDRGERTTMTDLDVVFSFGGDQFLRYKPGIITSRLGCFFREVIHLDIKTDMEHDIYDESMKHDILELGKERLIRVKELSYMTGIKPDLVSRITPGKLNVYLHMAAAKRSGMLIPDIKKHTERPKTLNELRKLDKGGTIFYPKPGVYENVAKCDFSSMYPNIIVRYNISPETMHCGCCENPILVPEAGWKICRKPGLIPQGIERVLKRRLELKKAMRAEADPLKKHELNLRQKALKNILVTCFGYLGFKNFIFSNVECKECVMLYGRHILERTKTMAEEEGLEVLYGVVDSVFVRGDREGGRMDYERFVKKASAEFGFELELDCIFQKLAFPSSDDGSGVANKYYGISGDKIEARGIAIRHSDSPVFIKEFQDEAIRALFKEGRDGLGKASYKYQKALKDKSVPFDSLIIHKSVRKTDSLTNQPHIVAYRQLKDGKGHVDFVFTVYGPKPAHMANKDEISVPSYSHLLRKAANELTLGLEGTI